MVTYYVREDGNDVNTGECNCATHAKKTVDAAKAVCAEGDVVFEGDKISKYTGLFPTHTKQVDGSFVVAVSRLPE
jgi:hypothetical protein